MTYLGAAPKTVRSLESSYLSNEIERNVQVIEEQHPDWTLYYEGESKLKSSYPSRMASFEYQQEILTVPIKVFSTVHIFLVDHRWFVKFRFTYPAASAEKYMPKVFNLVKSLTWPGEKPDNWSSELFIRLHNNSEYIEFPDFEVALFDSEGTKLWLDLASPLPNSNDGTKVVK
jgi:hypothetical protein